LGFPLPSQVPSPYGTNNGTFDTLDILGLWKARNKFVFEGFSATPEETLSTAIVLAREWALEVKPEPSLRPNQLTRSPTAPPHAIVMRSDAVWSAATNDTGLGWVSISTTGTQSFKAPTKSVSSPLTVEGLALQEAVRTCVSLGIKTVVFESDSLQLLKL
ncbi:unnamed protein product, partial [Brassica rapa]